MPLLWCSRVWLVHVCVCLCVCVCVLSVQLAVYCPRPPPQWSAPVPHLHAANNVLRCKTPSLHTCSPHIDPLLGTHTY